MVIMVIEDDAADAYDGNAAEDDVEENKTLIPLSEIVKATLSTFLSCFWAWKENDDENDCFTLAGQKDNDDDSTTKKTKSWFSTFNLISSIMILLIHIPSPSTFTIIITTIRNVGDYHGNDCLDSSTCSFLPTSTIHHTAAKVPSTEAVSLIVSYLQGMFSATRQRRKYGAWSLLDAPSTHIIIVALLNIIVVLIINFFLENSSILAGRGVPYLT